MFLGRAFALLAAFASSGTPLFAQMLRDAGWTPWQVSGARSLIGFLLVFAWQRSRLGEARKDPWGIAGTVVNSTVGTTVYLFAAMHASIGTVVSLLYLNAVWVVLWQRMRGRRERYDLVSSAMIVAGVALAVGPGGEGDTPAGIAAALVAGVTGAIYNVLSTRVTRSVGAEVASCYGLVGGALVFGPLVFTAPWDAPAAPLGAIGIGTVSGALFFVSAGYAFQRIGAEARMWFPFELIVAWSVQTLIHRSAPSVVSCAGIALIFSAALLLVWGKRQTHVVAAEPRPSS